MQKRILATDYESFSSYLHINHTDFFFNERSKCHMQMKTCGQHVVEAPYFHCKATKYCQRGLKCPKTKKKMICGSDGQFQASECEMKRENCG